MKSPNQLAVPTTMTEETESKREVIVSIKNSWGKATNETDALEEALSRVRESDIGNTERVEVVTVKGFRHVSMTGRVEADEIVNTETLEVNGRGLKDVIYHLEQAELEAEEVLVEGEKVDREGEQ